MTIPAWVGNYIGLPFEQYNCWQLVCKIYRERFDIKLPDFRSEYRNHLDARAIKKIYYREMYKDWRKVKPPKFGDCVLLKVRNQPWHVGLVLTDKTMLHTEQKIDSVIENFTSPMWQNNLMGFYRYAKS